MKQYLIDPFGGTTYLKNKIFESPYRVLQDLFAKRGIKLDTHDLGDLASADMVLCFNYNEEFYQKCLAAGLGKDKLALFVFEPEVVIPEQYRPEVWGRFGKVFTFLDDKVDNKRIFKLRYPQAQTPYQSQPEYEKRKFLTLINANKYSYVDRELYSLRRRAIRYFEKRFPDFDLYGFEWAKGSTVLGKKDLLAAVGAGKLLPFIRDYLEGRQPYKSYRGSVEDKYATMAGYKFSLCYENEHEVAGYITEKIFDSLVCGTVPIYLGASNITDYIPTECFIDMRNFKDFGKLADYLQTMSKDDWLKLQAAGQKYLESDKFKDWQPPAVFGSFVDVLAK